jgi:hypothetical protein
VQQFMLIAPFLMARNFLRSPDDHRDILKALFIGGLVYSVLMLVEVRLSPQLNIWVYGYFQHNFDQMIRFGGFRPIVFLYHGLWVSFFAMTAAVSAVALARGSVTRIAIGFWLAAAYLLLVLVLSKSLGAIIYGVALIPLVAVLSSRMQLRVAALLAFVALAYPVMKGADLVPQEAMLQQAAKVDDDRANSLRFRFQQETILLQRAQEKPLFGWGLWGRNHIWDGATRSILTVTDGRWIIIIGVLGWVGFLAEFGLLAWPILLIWRKSGQGALSPWVGPMALMPSVSPGSVRPPPGSRSRPCPDCARSYEATGAGHCRSGKSRMGVRPFGWMVIGHGPARGGPSASGDTDPQPRRHSARRIDRRCGFHRYRQRGDCPTLVGTGQGLADGRRQGLDHVAGDQCPVLSQFRAKGLGAIRTAPEAPGI